MKKSFLVVAIILFAAVAVLLFHNLNTPKSSTEPTASSAQAGNPATPQNNSTNVPVVPSIGAAANATAPNDLASRAASPNPPAASEVQNLPPLTVLDNARVAMHNYGSTFGENPVGTNPEITAALMGRNPKQINFITPESGLRINENGEMVDGYGTPFFFHQLSGQEMEIRSAGEDRKMWTFDDQVTR
jgi:hypothetical protein